MNELRIPETTAAWYCVLLMGEEDEEQAAPNNAAPTGTRSNRSERMKISFTKV
jgi:hypothetical protein